MRRRVVVGKVSEGENLSGRCRLCLKRLCLHDTVIKVMSNLDMGVL
jgi:hypothetical protein